MMPDPRSAPEAPALVSMPSRRHRRPDLIARGSLFLMCSTATTAALGFAFWIVVARLYTPTHIGLATSLISATSLIGYLGLFGLNNTIIRFPARRERNAQLSQALLLVATAAAAIGTAYLAGLSWYGEKLLFVREDPVLALLFVVFCVLAALNLLTDAVFIGERKTQYNVVVDGLIQGLTKLALPAVLVTFGAFGIFGAVGAGYLIAVLSSVVLMRYVIGFRFDLRKHRKTLLEKSRFSAANYVSSTLVLAPNMVVPLIVLQELGPDAVGCYYIAFQIANLVNSLAYAVGETAFAEVAHDESRFTELLGRSARLLAAFQIPAATAVIALSDPLLRFFGETYAREAQPLLIVLTLGAFAVGLNTWASLALKLTNRLGALVQSNVVYAVVTTGLTVVLASHALVWIGWAWLCGNLASGVYAAASLFRGHQPTPKYEKEQP